jgi:uncharacterized protein YbjQ (UPF0145 family)
LPRRGISDYGNLGKSISFNQKRIKRMPDYYTPELQELNNELAERVVRAVERELGDESETKKASFVVNVAITAARELNVEVPTFMAVIVNLVNYMSTPDTGSEDDDLDGLPVEVVH